MPAETRSLAETVVVITGASSGIGAATARLLVEEGAKVVLGARRANRLEELVSEFGPESALAVTTDVTVPQDCRHLVDEAVKRFGRLDSVVVSAGMGAYGGILDGSDDSLARMVDVNYTGTIWAIRAAVAQFLAAQSGGDIVVIASVAGLRGGGNEAVYVATKFAQVGLDGALDREVREYGIRVTAIAPAATKTEFAIGCGRLEDDPVLDDYLAPEDVALTVKTVLAQPRRLRTTLWALWSMAEAS
jgi:3-oxoacyl-[acyl-carrier protein] reductase